MMKLMKRNDDKTTTTLPILRDDSSSKKRELIYVHEICIEDKTSYFMVHFKLLSSFLLSKLVLDWVGSKI